MKPIEAWVIEKDGEILLWTLAHHSEECVRTYMDVRNENLQGCKFVAVTVMEGHDDETS